MFKALSVNHRDLIRAILKGQAAMSKSSGGSGGDSASLLMGGRTEQAAPSNKQSTANDSASLLTGGSPSSQVTRKAGSQSKSRKSVSKVMLRSPKANWNGQVRNLTLTEIAVSITFDEVPPPALLDQVVVDLQVPDSPDDIARINGFVTQLTLKEKSLECRSASLGLSSWTTTPTRWRF